MKTEGEVSDWLLEKIARGEIDAAESAWLAARLRGPEGAKLKEELALRMAALEESSRQILAQHPPAQVAAEVRRRLALAEQAERRSTPGAARVWWVLGGVATGGVALAALLLLVRPADQSGSVVPGVGLPLPGEEAAEITTIKGLKPQLAIYRKRKEGGDRADRLSAGTVVRPGDTLQLAYVSAGRPYGVVASVDARGTVTLHLPEGDGPAARLAPRGETPLPHAFQLDATPGFERFVLIVADQPFSTALVREALRPGGPPLPANLQLNEHTLSKETP